MTYAARVSPVGWIRLLLLLCILFSLSRADHDPKREPKKVISLAKSMQITQRSLQDPSVEEIRKQYWRKALEDIRNMSAFGSSSRKSPGSDWKRGFVQSTTIRAARGASPTNGTTTSVDILENVNLTLAVPVDANKRQRFEGFLSWDRLLQEWSDEVQEHLLQVEKETADYSLGNFGRARPEEHVAAAVDDTVTTEEPTPLVPLDASSEMTHSPSQPTPTTSEPDVSSKTISPPVNGSSRKERTLLPVPAPAQPGEAVLPHTDLSDLSKRVEIVTTASLPWRTGTAVNPLLRAAYLTEGRKGAGGSVTLTLPWLERRVDQETVYGRNQAFESPADQEAYIRTWLRDTAAMPEAANDLRIRWYKAWYVPVENSVYSMGDIIALIPADEVDICILEEPEHLNWYRAPGESWTKKFPHVVGILHTNYFQVRCQTGVGLFVLAATFSPNMSYCSSTRWTSRRLSFVHLPCASCVHGCVGRIVIVSSSCRAPLIRRRRKKSWWKMSMEFEAPLSILVSSCVKSCRRPAVRLTPSLPPMRRRRSILSAKCCGQKV